MSQTIKLEVSRASHTHHSPHALRAHSGPVIRASAPKTNANSADASAFQSDSLFCPNRNMALYTPETMAAIRNSQADGMWK